MIGYNDIKFIIIDFKSILIYAFTHIKNLLKGKLRTELPDEVFIYQCDKCMEEKHSYLKDHRCEEHGINYIHAYNFNKGTLINYINQLQHQIWNIEKNYNYGKSLRTAEEDSRKEEEGI
ncbi:MAG: hypothetical protein WA130_02155 [Candidatus Methanoperedens sp.]